MINTDILQGVVSANDFILDSKAPFSLDGVVSLTFYSDGYITPVAPTGGTAEISLTEDGFNYGSITNGLMTFPVDAYDRPYFFGYFLKAKLTLAGITGATHFTFRVHTEKEAN
jgi:hypothetical protein